MATKTAKKETKTTVKKASKPAAKKPTTETKSFSKMTAPKVGEKMAVIKTGGKQYLVQVGDVLSIETISNLKEGETKITFDQILMIDDGKTTKVGTPTVSGAKVTANILEAYREKKITVIRYRAKSRHFKKNGHRQHKLKVEITDIK